MKSLEDFLNECTMIQLVKQLEKAGFKIKFEAELKTSPSGKLNFFQHYTYLVYFTPEFSEKIFFSESKQGNFYNAVDILKIKILKDNFDFFGQQMKFSFDGKNIFLEKK